MRCWMNATLIEDVDVVNDHVLYACDGQEPPGVETRSGGN